METARKIITYVATSADGYIARPDGDVEWLNRLPPTVDHGMGKLLSHNRYHLVGTQDLRLGAGLSQEGGNSGQHLRQECYKLRVLAKALLEKRYRMSSLCPSL